MPALSGLNKFKAQTEEFKSCHLRVDGAKWFQGYPVKYSLGLPDANVEPSEKMGPREKGAGAILFSTMAAKRRLTVCGG